MTMALATPKTAPTTARDDLAFASVVRRYAGPVHAAARRQLGDVHLAEDATQAVFLALHGAANVPDDRLAGWLFTATRNVCRNLNRSRARRAKHERAAMPTTPADPDTYDDLDEAIACLGAAERRLIVDRYFANRSTSELAASLGLAEPAVRKRLSRALNTLHFQIFCVRGLRPRMTGSEEEGGKLSAAVATTLAGTAADAAVAPAVLASVAAATPAAATAAVALTTVAKVSGGLIAGVAAVVVVGSIGVAVVTLGGGGASVASNPTTAPAGMLASDLRRSPVLGAPQTEPPLVPGGEADEARQLAAAGDYLGAMRRYAVELAALDVGQYRDKKDFAWIAEFATTADDRAKLWQAAKGIVRDADRDASIVDWRAARLFAQLAERDGDKVARLAALDEAIRSYPDADYGTLGSKLSSLQHLYNDRSGVEADAHGFGAGTAMLLDALKADRRLTYVFTPPWKERAERDGKGDEYRVFVGSLIDAYAARSAGDPARREVYDAAIALLRAESEGK